MKKLGIRLLFFIISIVLIALLINSSPALSASTDVISADSMAPSADGITVITTQDAGRETLETAEIVAFAPNGSVLYYNDSKGTYFDVDPVPNTSHTVSYVATEFVSESTCPAREACVRNQLVRTNLSTGDSTVLYERLRMDTGDSRWHDADRINSTHYIIADLSSVDRVYVVNTSSGVTEWSWAAQSDFNVTSGDGFGHTWSHINDVEVLDDGRIMVSMRNQDQVVFLNRTTGVEEDWTLGTDDQYSTLYEQHNPDYIPESAGGPAVLVADSENDRIVEYQRSGDSWEKSWTYRDAGLRWPRDADRLPNGHTLITDSNGDRVFEIDDSGRVVWSVDVALPYEAERLSTPDESGGGPGAATADLPSSSVDGMSGDGDQGSAGFGSRVIDYLVPDAVTAALFFISPSWVSANELVLAAGFVTTVVAWAGFEVYSANVRIVVSLPVTVRRQK